MPTAKKARDTLVQAHEVGALVHQENYFTEIPHASVRMPIYKANDSDDLHLMELISPAHELHRKLIEGRRPMTQQHNLPSTNKSSDNTPRTMPYKQAFKTLRELPLSGTKLKARDLADRTAQARPKSAAAPKKLLAVEDLRRGTQTRKPSKKKQSILTLAEQIHQNPPNFEAIKIYNSDLLTHRERVNPDEDRVTPSGFLSERRRETKLGDEQRASDLRLISKLWHQECKSSVAVQQRLAHLLDAKYNQAFVDGRMYSLKKCKHNDFKAEVAQILKKSDRAGAPQLATLGVKRALAVACVDEALGEGMGEEYVTLEMCFVQPAFPSAMCSTGAAARDASVVTAVVGRVQRAYADVGRITAFMLHQLCLSGPL